MKSWSYGLLISSVVASGLAIAQQSVELGPGGIPRAPGGLAGSLQPGPFEYRTGEGQGIRVVVVARLNSPYSLVFMPNGDLLVSQRAGKLQRLPKGGSSLVEVTGGPLSIVPNAPATHGYMSVVLHPQFERNGLLYLAYTKPLKGDDRTVAVVRARYVDNHLVDAADVWVGENTRGPSALAMTPDSKLWIALSALNPLTGKGAQDPMSFEGKVLRLNEDGTVPKDNPFVGRQGYRPEIYTMGHRTALGLTLNPTSSEVFMSEMGPNGGDEINLLKPGRNYGWPVVSLGRAYPGPWHAEANEPTHHGFELPLVYWMPSISVSGLSFYKGAAFPKWQGNLFVGGLRYGEVPGTGRVDRVVLNEKFEELRRESLLQDLHQRIRDVKVGPDGLIYVATDEEQGAVLRIEPALNRSSAARPLAAPDFRVDAKLAARGALEYNRCGTCHGLGVLAGNGAPDLRASAVPLTASSFEQVVRKGALAERGMPAFEDLDATALEALRHYIRAEANTALASVKTP
jgi:aldose sugar dehydrogenase